MKFRESYGVTKGSPECQVEDPPLGSLAPPGDLEENASHHFLDDPAGNPLKQTDVFLCHAQREPKRT